MEIWLSNGTKDKLKIPVNPQSIGYNDTRNFEDIILANGDEKTVISGRNLRNFSISSFFPKKATYYMKVKDPMTPMEYVKKIKKWMDDKKVLHLQVTTTNINDTVTIRSFDWEENGGSVGDINYTIELREYQPITYTKIQAGSGKQSTTTKRPPAPKPVVKSHVVKKGENLSVISKKYYGSQSHWKTIYEANKKIIGSNPNLIKPGQKLVIPNGIAFTQAAASASAASAKRVASKKTPSISKYDMPYKGREHGMIQH